MDAVGASFCVVSQINKLIRKDVVIVRVSRRMVQKGASRGVYIDQDLVVGRAVVYTIPCKSQTVREMMNI